MRLPVGSRIFLAACCAQVAIVSAGPPTVGPQQRIDIAGQTAASNETSAAARGANPSEIVGTWNDWRESGAGEVIRLGVALSTNGGLTWTDFVLRPPEPNQTTVEGDPMAAVDPRTGSLWVGAISFSSNGGLFVARKDPGDDHFQPSVMADTGGGIDKGWMAAGRNEITADSTAVYIAYNFGIVRSDDLGDTWSNSVSLGGGLGFLPRVGPNGEVYVSSWDFGDEFNLQRSLDGGQTFASRVIALRMDSWGIETNNSRFPGTFRVPPLPTLAVDPSSGTLYAAWPDTTDQAGGQANVDVYFSRSTDQGDNWTTPLIVNGEGPNVGDQFFPWIEVDSKGRLHLLYLDSRHTVQNDNDVNGFFDAYYAYSEDSGNSWTEIRLTPVSWNSEDDGLNRPSQFIGDYLGMAVADDTVWPVYPDTTSGDTDIYTNEISFSECSLPGEVAGLLLDRSAENSTLTLNWTDLPNALDYIVFQDFAPNGTFGFAGTSSSGVLGLTIAEPAGTRYYLVAARNVCGIGPQ